MKRHNLHWAKAFLCCMTLLSTMAISTTPVHAEWVDGVELNVEKQFGASDPAFWNGAKYWESGTYEVTDVTEDTYDVTLRYYVHNEEDNSTSGEGYTYQYAPVYPYIDGRELGVFKDRLDEHLGVGKHLMGTLSTTVARDGRSIRYELVDWKEADGSHTAISVDGYVQINPLQYTVTFTNGAGYIYHAETVIRRQNATAPANPSITGYTFQGWDRGWTNIMSDITVNATWNRLPPSISIRETVYEKGQNVDRNTLIQNATADDIREGNIGYKVVPSSPIINNGRLDTSQEGVWDVIYTVTNNDDIFHNNDKTVEKPGKIHIVDTGSHTSFENSSTANIYSRFISGNEMLNGEVPVNNLIPYSVWRRDSSASMNQQLNNSLHNTTPLSQYNYINGR